MTLSSSKLHDLSRQSWFIIVILIIRCTTGGAVDVTLMVYGVWGPPYIMTSLPQMGPGYETALQKVNSMYSDRFNLSLAYVASKDVKLCEDQIAYYDDVSRFYYSHQRTSKNNDSVLVLLYSCTFLFVLQISTYHALWICSYFSETSQKYLAYQEKKVR